MVGVKSVVHLAGAERGGLAAGLRGSGCRRNTSACGSGPPGRCESGLLFVSHLGAEPSSAFPALRAKALAEEAIRKSDLPYTIIRSSLVYGEGDRFTTSLAMLLGISHQEYFQSQATERPPFSQYGWTIWQPAWRGRWKRNRWWVKTYDVGGPEFLTLRQVVEMVMQAAGSRRWLLNTSPLYLRGMTWALQRILPNPPLTTFWFDYLASSRTASLDAMPTIFGLKPSMMIDQLRYLGERNWIAEFMGRQIGTCI